MSVVIKTGETTFTGGEAIVNFDSTFSASPTVTCTAITKNINIYIKSITTSGFTVSSSTSESVTVSYIAILKQ